MQREIIRLHDYIVKVCKLQLEQYLINLEPILLDKDYIIIVLYIHLVNAQRISVWDFGNNVITELLLNSAKNDNVFNSDNKV